MSHGVGDNSPMKTVPERWGYPFWDVVRDMAEQGLNRTQVGKALGYRSRRFLELLREHPEHDPFDPSSVVSCYIKDTGEGFRAALERMAREHYTLAAAAQVIGYSSPDLLRRQMNQRGISIKFERFDSIGEYERKHHIDLESALRRMSSRGYSRNAAARELGLNSGQALKYQMQVRKIDVDFPGPKRIVRTRSTEIHPWRKQMKREIKS